MTRFVPCFSKVAVQSHPLEFFEEKFQAQQADDNQKPKKSRSLEVVVTPPTIEGAITITVKTNADTASLKINDEEQGGRADGNYSIKRVARVGQDTQFTITAVDVYEPVNKIV